MQLWRMSYPGGTVSPITNDLSNFVGADVSADRNSLVTSRSEMRVGLWVGDSAGTRGTDEVARFSLSATLMTIVWAGDRLMYDSTVNGQPAIGSVTPGAGASADLLSDAGLPYATSDGKTVVFTGISNDPDKAGLWRVDGTSGTRPARFLSGDALSPVLTRDDQFVVFLSVRSGLQTPWIVPLAGGEPKKIVDLFAGVNTLDVHPDGRRIVFVTSETGNQFKLVLCDLPDCGNRATLSMPDNFRYVTTRFTPDGRGIAYVDTSGANIWIQPIAGGPPRQLTQFTDRSIVGFAFSRDRKRLAIARATITNDIVLFRNK
jgi:Tol biopolymer transport system component